MQTLWSRLAATTKLNCRCPSCSSHITHGVVRRPITAAGKKPRYAYSSTLFFSGIFAAAATTDAAVKQRRRDQWDAAIAKVKQDIHAKENVRQDDSLETYVPNAVTVTSNDELEAEALFEDERYVDHNPIWPANTGPPLIRHNLPPQSEYASEHSSGRAAMRLWSPKKLRTTELCVDRLILRMLLYLDDLGQLKSTAASVPPSFQPLIQRPREELEDLLLHTEKRLNAVGRSDPHLTTNVQEKYPFHQPIHAHSARYIQDSDGSHLDIADELLESLKSVFHSKKPDIAAASPSPGSDTFPATIAKVCYNLSVSTAPPSLRVWNCVLKNILVASKDEEPITYVIDCIRRAHVRMNENTLVSILNHAVLHDNSAAFIKSVGYMRGEYGGLMLARPDINITESGGASRLIRVDEDKVIQKPYPTPKVFEALINGVLHFAGFESALAICGDMGHDGWGLSIRGLVPLLRDCVGRQDWESGQAVWTQMNLLKEKSRRDGRAERLPRMAYVDMARLCLERGDEVMFHEIAEQAVRDKYQHKRLLEKVVEAMERLPPPEEIMGANVDKDKSRDVFVADPPSVATARHKPLPQEACRREHLMSRMDDPSQYEVEQRHVQLNAC